MINRGNARVTIFRKPEDYAAFEHILAVGIARYPCQILAYQLMTNHWHFVLRPTEDGGMSNFLRWISLTHTMRLHAHYQTAGEGHVYQGRFKSFPVQDDEHFLAVCRYVERNALRAPRSPQWDERVNAAVADKEMQTIRRCVNRGSPFGGKRWVDSVARRLGLETTLRRRGRPKKES